LRVVRIKPATPGWHHYSISRNGDHVMLSRTSSKGKTATISFTHDDAIVVANALVDALETREQDQGPTMNDDDTGQGPAHALG
jgi:hypothetical protein